MAAQSTDTMTIRLSSSVKDKLTELAQHTRRSKSFLASEAIADYVDRELTIVGSIQRGLEDMKAGRVTPHDEVMTEIDEIIAQSESGRKAG
ncbi:MAG: CopG family ribbon-helix-helix protein [Rhizobium sp.]|nr:CopG family ribbon-helix-helix protein [Rhizobium sp.]